MLNTGPQEPLHRHGRARGGAGDSSSTRVGIAAVRNTGRRILGSVSTRNLGTGSAQNTGHRGISIRVFRSNHTVGSRGLSVDSRKGTCRCSRLLNSRSFLLAIGSVKLRAKFR